MAKHNNNILRMPSKTYRKSTMDDIFVLGFCVHKGFSPLSWIVRLMRNLPYSHICVKFRDKKFKQAKVFYNDGININFSAEKNFDKNHKTVVEYPIQVNTEFCQEFLNECFRHANVKYNIFNRKKRLKIYEWLTAAIQEKDENWTKLNSKKVTHRDLFFYFRGK
jgi:hypothetical protein